jgi:hypothetical protein
VSSSSTTSKRTGGAVGSPAAAPTSPDPVTAPAGAATDGGGTPVPPRQVRLTAARVNPVSVMKIAFLVSVALGIALVVVVAILWTLLDSMGVFDSVNGVIREVVGSESGFDLVQVLGLSRVLSLTVVVAVVDVVLLTLLSTLGAVLYNLCSALVGGLRLTLTDD